MSRIGRLPVPVPSNVKVDIQGSFVKVQGPQGEMSRQFSPSMDISMENDQIVVKRPSDEAQHRALHGTTRALLSNMVTGVSTGFSIVLEIEGVGYRAELDGAKLVLYLGYSHPVVIEPPDGVKFEVDTKTRQVKLSGKDKEQLGQLATIIRSYRPPEPYHGKGIKYAGEKIRRKAGKSGKAKK